VPVQAEDVLSDVETTGDRGQVADHRIDPHVAACRDVDRSAPENCVAALAYLVELDRAPGSAGANADDAFERPAGHSDRRDEQRGNDRDHGGGEFRHSRHYDRRGPPGPQSTRRGTVCRSPAVLIQVARRFILVLALGIGLTLPARAGADVGLYPTTKEVPVGGVIAGRGDGSGMAAYLVPAASGPRRYTCHGHGICEPQVKSAPRAPFTLLGRLRRTKNVYATQSFSFRTPADLKPGVYRLYLYCRPCGGSLIQSGRHLNGETIRVTARPQSRTVQVGQGATRRRFLMSEPAGVILLLRLTVPHGTRAVANGSIPGVAGVRISTVTASCRHTGSVDVCTQPEEWCPMPAAAWHFRLDKIWGPVGSVRLDFVVGNPPG
jgi:hypothetical protein